MNCIYFNGPYILLLTPRRHLRARDSQKPPAGAEVIPMQIDVIYIRKTSSLILQVGMYICNAGDSMEQPGGPWGAGAAVSRRHSRRPCRQSFPPFFSLSVGATHPDLPYRQVDPSFFPGV